MDEDKKSKNSTEAIDETDAATQKKTVPSPATTTPIGKTDQNIQTVTSSKASPRNSRPDDNNSGIDSVMSKSLTDSNIPTEPIDGGADLVNQNGTDRNISTGNGNEESADQRDTNILHISVTIFSALFIIGLVAAFAFKYQCEFAK